MERCNKKYDLGEFTAVEQHAIEQHKYYLSEDAGFDVGIEYAIEHWLVHCARQWHQDRLKTEMHAQKEEIQKHKWLESEKAGTDLGQHAVLDWITRHAAAWREWREQSDD